MFNEAMPAPVTEEYALIEGKFFDAHSGTLLSDKAIWVRGERVEAVCRPSDLPADLPRIGLSGHTILPGFIDGHVHTEEWHAPLFLAKGVTTVRDLGCELESILDRRTRWSAAAAQAPRLICTGPVLDSPGNTWSEVTRIVRSPAEARLAVDALAARGVDQIKTYALLDLPTYRAIVDQAHHHGKRVISHLGKHVNARQAIEAGVDEIEHLSGVSEAMWWEKNEASDRWEWIQLWSEIDLARMEALIDLILAQKTRMAITRLVWLRLAGAWDPRHRDHPQMAYVPGPLLKFWDQFLPHQEQSREYPKDIRVPTRQDRLQMVAGMTIFTTELIKRKARILVGSDVPFLYLIPGFSFHDELWALLECGAGEAAVLQAATLHGAEALEIDHLAGSIDAGKQADLLIVRGNPLEDMRDLEQIAATVRGGCWHDPQELLAKARAYAQTATESEVKRFNQTY
jgi:imidazolonepropionase-like amidohydrolase